MSHVQISLLFKFEHISCCPVTRDGGRSERVGAVNSVRRKMVHRVVRCCAVAGNEGHQTPIAHVQPPMMLSTRANRRDGESSAIYNSQYSVVPRTDVGAILINTLDDDTSCYIWLFEQFNVRLKPLVEICAPPVLPKLYSVYRRSQLLCATGRIGFDSQVLDWESLRVGPAELDHTNKHQVPPAY